MTEILKTKDLEKYVIENLDLFSPTFLSSRFGVDQGLAYEICEKLCKNFDVVKCYSFDCPGCGASTGEGGEFPVQYLDYISCDSCSFEAESEEFLIVIYYKNNQKKKKSNKKECSTKVRTYQSDINNLKLSFEETEIFTSKDSLIWHLSDPHFGSKPLWKSPNHCESTFLKFQELVEKRCNISKDDYYIFSGDMTTNGHEENIAILNDKMKALISVGVRPDRLIVVPGNHDGWLGEHQLKVIPSYFKHSSLYRRNVTKVTSWTAAFEQFNSQPIIYKSASLNNIHIEFILVDTSIRKELSRGHFPSSELRNIDPRADVRVLIMHHHILNLKKSELGTIETLKESAMKVVNCKEAEDWIKGASVDIVLHGHKHFQFFNHKRSSPFVIAAPSLCEQAAVSKEKRQTPNHAGFNCFRLKGDEIDIALIKFDDNFIVKEYFSKYKIK